MMLIRPFRRFVLYLAYQSVYGNEHNILKMNIRMVTTLTEQCWSGFQCVEISQMSEDVLILRVGQLTFSPGKSF